MRKLLVAVAVAGLGGVAGLPSNAEAAQALTGKFTVHFPKSGQMLNVFPCPADVFCGAGDLGSYGSAVLSVVDSNFQPIAGTNCLSFDKEDDVSLAADGSTLAMVGSGVLCLPGSSGNVPSNSHNQDYGHPSHWTSNLKVDGSASSGVFAGATGAVIERFTAAGGVGIWTLTGTISSA